MSHRSRLRASLLVLSCFGLILAFGFWLPGEAQAREGRLVLAFYYSWYDAGTWSSGQLSDAPLAPYNSDDPAVMARHIQQAQSAGIDAFVFNWWGQGNRTEANLVSLLEVAAQQGFRVAVDFDINSPTMSGVDSYAVNLRHLHATHAAHPAYLRFADRPVVFFYNVARLPVSSWQALRDQVDPGRNALWIAEGVDLRYQAVFDGHHLYSITWPNRISPSQTLRAWGERLRRYNRQHSTAKLWVATVMPGYDDRAARPAAGFVRDRDGGEYFRQCWQAAIASQPDWVIVNSFNEWAEGTQIEPSRAYASAYLDLTREWAERFRKADFIISEAKPPPPRPSTVTEQAADSQPTPTPHPPPASSQGISTPPARRYGPACRRWPAVPY